VISSDARLVEELGRIAAAAGGLDLDVRPHAGAARVAWARTPLVVVGDDQVAAVHAAGLPRRARVVVVTTRPGSGDTRDGGDDVWRGAVAVGADAVLVLGAAEFVSAEVFADSAEERGTPGVVVATIGGRGGAGATTLAVAIAVRSAARSVPTLLIDADPLGGGIDLALGCEETPGCRWDDIPATRGRIDATALLASLPHAGDLRVLAHARSAPESQHALPVSPSQPGPMRAVVAAAARACDLVVVDLPRSLGPAAEVVLGAAARTYVIVPAEVRATAAAVGVARAVRACTADARAVVRGPAPAGLPAGVIAEALGLPLAAELRAEPGLARALEFGETPATGRRSPLARFADDVLRDLGAHGEAAA
jgi:secretion/DNA translocation related CpaE-like protein